ncbi:SusC/RagA family TonB-linked outer membrane protein [Myroides fluvii]|uniref:SusC/RagA family TonB-linked outer membrane protein n=1 Tax=Myroides fluvii TaxID=2572594 RepID=UPI00131CD6C4|nr:TonB-dependent receptor [Myroides fluvii]
MKKLTYIKHIVFTLFLLLLTSGYAQVQVVSIEGKVEASDGHLPGAIVRELVSSKTVVTDLEGRFKIPISTKQGWLEISMYGYSTKKVAFEAGKELHIYLLEENKQLDEVVVVAYGEQKKENLTGAVDQIKGSELENRPLPNAALGLQGLVANLNIAPTDGKPTQSPRFNIRGATSIGQGGSALVLIDGVEGNPALLNANDIESVSVLKDAASAAIYGARGAFGVVLITTKKPKKDHFVISYSQNMSFKKPTRIPDFVTDSYTWASMFNEAFSSWNNYSSTPQNVNKTMPFSQAYLQELERRSKDPNAPKVEIDPLTGEYIYYDNTDWQKLLYKDQTYALTHNLYLSSGTDKSQFSLSGQIIDQKGMFRYNSDDYKMYNFRAVASSQLKSWLDFSNTFSFAKTEYHNPLNVGEAGGIWRNMVAEGHPMSPMLNPDGTLTHSAAYTVGDFYYGKNGMDKNNKLFKNTTSFKANVLAETLSVNADFTYQMMIDEETRRRVPVPYSKAPGVIQYLGASTNDYRVMNRNTEFLTSNLYVKYKHQLNKHNFNVLVGLNQEMSTFKSTGSQRNGLLFDEANDLNLATGEAMIVSGGYERWTVLGGFYRLTYDYDNRYLLELNGRYDGSSKFPANERFAFFPSVSAGWNISNEPFWTVSPQYISLLKVRGSYGALGNGNIRSYSFVEQLAINRELRILNGELANYTSAPGVIPKGLTWETVTTQNLGLDVNFFNNRLTFSGDVYSRTTKDMFTLGPELPAVFGSSSPKGNYADLRTKGWEITVNWRDQFTVLAKPFKYNVRFTLADNTTEILKYNNPTQKLNDYYEGQRLGEIWGYVTDGFFTSEDHIKGSANQDLFSSTAQGVWRPGDIKFLDLNNDGVIDNGDNTVGNPGDRKVIGNALPRYTFGLQLSGDWNNFFFSAFFQGVGKQDWYPSKGANSFWGQYNAPYGHPLQSQLDDIWTEENPNAYFPRYTGYLAWSDSGTLRQTQTKYLQNVAYIRLKNIQLGYDLAPLLPKHLGVETLQLYVSGENLFTYSPFYKRSSAIDVENIGSSDQDVANTNHGDGFNYPILKSLSFGINISF